MDPLLSVLLYVAQPSVQSLSLSGMYSASVVDNPLVIGGLLVAGFAMLMLLIATAYFVIKSVFSLSFFIGLLQNLQTLCERRNLT